MAIGIVKTINGVKQLVPLTTDSGQGLPLGAWTSFEDDQPRNGYLKAGTTFNQADYPALYNMLGTNVIPDKGYGLDWDNKISVTMSTTEWRPPKNGFLIGEFYAQSGQVELYVNGNRFATSHGGSIDYPSIQMEVATNDVFKTNSNDINNQRFWFIPYLHPMFIKAVIGPIEDSAADQVVQNINNSRSYSTEEVNTGKKWIDGKPIYRRAFEYTASVGGEFEIADTTSWNIDKVTLLLGISNGLSYGSGIVQGSYFATAADRYRTMILANKKLVWDCGTSSSATITVEYTKTTD